ncbi:MAG: ABC transporter ATP-binding protein, partial [Deltaproteobacteria bacterium]
FNTGFTIETGLALDEELLVLFGPSGAGKTQILRMLSGIITPDSGAVSVGGETLFDSNRGINAPIRERKIGYLFQDYALFPHMTVFGNISYGINHLEKRRVSEKVAELLGVMRLSGLEDRYPHELSGGQKQRTALARTLATEPRVLLLDEPFSALDYQVREKLRTDLLNIHNIYPITTIFVTHDLEEAFMLGKSIAIINNGRLEQTGSREDVFYRPRTRNVARFLGFKNIFDGTVDAVDGDQAAIRTRELGLIKANVPSGAGLSAGRKVSFCIRPEEIIVIRPDRALENRVQDNILEGEILDVAGKGSTQILYLKVGEGEGLLKIELPNFVLRKLALAQGKRIRVSLKKEDIWVIP